MMQAGSFRETQEAQLGDGADFTRSEVQTSYRQCPSSASPFSSGACQDLGASVGFLSSVLTAKIENRMRHLLGPSAARDLRPQLTALIARRALQDVQSQVQLGEVKIHDGVGLMI